MKLQALLFALLMLLAPGVAEARSTLIYKLPEGWVDVSAGAPQANFKGLSPAFVAEATSSKFELFALDRRSGEAFEPRIFALTFPNDAPITQVAVDEYAAETARSLADAGTPTRLIEQEIVSRSGVRCGRVLLEKTEGNTTRRILIYLIPDGDLTVTLFFMSDARTFEQHLGVFEATANATSGAIPATNATLRKTALSAIRSAGQVSTVPRAASPFMFSIPSGMTDVATPGFDPVLEEEARRANFAMYAIGENGETFNAVVVDGALLLREEDLDEMAKAFEGSFAAVGRSAKVTLRTLVNIGSVRAARLMFETEIDGVPLRGLWYAVPGASRYARLTYLCSASVFPRLLPGFEASAGATIGATSPEPTLRARGLRIMAGGVAAVLILPALILGLILVLRSRRPPAPRS